MTTGLWLALRRITVFVLLFTAASWAMIQSPSMTVILNVQDRILFFLAAAVFGGLLARLKNTLTAPNLTSLHIHSTALACVMLGFIISAMSSVTWRTAGHSMTFVDGPSRVVFRNLYILAEVGLLLTVIPADVQDAAAKWVQIGKVLAVVGLLMLAMSYVDHFPGWLRFRTEVHDTSPLGPDTNGVP